VWITDIEKAAAEIERRSWDSSEAQSIDSILSILRACSRAASVDDLAGAFYSAVRYSKTPWNEVLSESKVEYLKGTRALLSALGISLGGAKEQQQTGADPDVDRQTSRTRREHTPTKARDASDSGCAPGAKSPSGATGQSSVGRESAPTSTPASPEPASERAWTPDWEAIRCAMKAAIEAEPVGFEVSPSGLMVAHAKREYERQRTEGAK
jgi:hypothetical protein